VHKRKINFLLNNQLITFLLAIYICGFIFGVFFKDKPIAVELENTNKTFSTFLNIFCMHYWYFFVIWLMGLCTIGFLINILINFFRSFVFAVVISTVIKVSFRVFILLIISEIIIFLPIFIYLLYLSTFLSISNFLNVFSKKRILVPFNTKNYLNIMLFITCMLIIYSIILLVI